MTSTITDRIYGESASVAVKAPCVAVSVGQPLPLAGLGAVGSYAPQVNDRILVKDQTDPTANGIYNASNGAWTRSGDFDGIYDAVQGTLIAVISPTAGGSIFYQLTTLNPIIGTTPLNFSSFINPTSITYNRTPAEFAAGVVPTNLFVPSYPILGYVAANRYGPDPTGVIDATAILQGALDVGGAGSTVWLAPGNYRVNGTLNKYPGQIIKGAGWATTPLTFLLAAGSTVITQYSLLDIPLIQTVGVSDAAQIERGGLEDIALINSVPGSLVGTGYYANFSRQEKLDNVYISSFAKPLVFDNVCWLMEVNHCRFMDFTAFGLTQNSSSEDNLFTNCQFSGYWPQAVAVKLANESANTTFINCYFQGCNHGVVMQQGDTNGDGSGIPFPMNASFLGCLMEDITQAGFVMVTSAISPADGNIRHPGLTIKHLRAFNSGNFTSTLNVTGASGTGAVATLVWTQPITTAQIPPVGSQITVSGMTPAGYNGSHIVTASTLNSVSFASATAGFAVGGTFIYGAQSTNGQSLIYAQHASQIDVQDVYANGFSFGATIMGQTFSGIAGFQYGFFYTVNTAPVGPVLWAQDNNAIYGTSRFQGVTGQVTKIPGDRPRTRLTAAALAYVATNFTVVPFNGVVSDFPQWYNNANTGFQPLRNQAVRFRTQIYTGSAPIGRYTLLLFKNGAQLAVLFDQQNGVAGQPILMQGEAEDVPNGTTDFYNIVVVSSASWALDTTAGNTWATAELCGL